MYSDYIKLLIKRSSPYLYSSLGSGSLSRSTLFFSTLTPYMLCGLCLQVLTLLVRDILSQWSDTWYRISWADFFVTHFYNLLKQDKTTPPCDPKCIMRVADMPTYCVWNDCFRSFTGYISIICLLIDAGFLAR